MGMITMMCIGLSMSYKRLPRVLFLGFGVSAAVAVILSLSRGGIISLGCSLLFFFTTFSVCRSSRKNLFIVVCLTLLVPLILFLSGDLVPILERMKTLETPLKTGISRLEIWKNALKLIADDLWHNDYLEFGAEMGITGVLSAFMGITILFIFVLKKLICLKEKRFQTIGLGALSGCFIILVHGGTDFNFQIPSNSILFAVCAAIALVCANSDKKDMISLWIDVHLRSRMRLFFYSFIFILSGTSLTVVLAPFLGSIYLEDVKEFQRSRNYYPAEQALERAIFFEPGNAELLAEAGDMYVDSANNTKDRVEKKVELEKSLRYYNDAIEVFPERSYFHVKKAYILQGLGRLQESEKALQNAIYLDPTSSSNYYVLAEQYIERGDLDNALENFKKYIEASGNYKQMDMMLDAVWEISKDYNELKKMVPENAFYRNLFAQYLFKKDKITDGIKELAYAFSLEPILWRARKHLYKLRSTGDSKLLLKTLDEYHRQFGSDVPMLELIAEMYGEDKKLAVIKKLILLNPKKSLDYKVSFAEWYCRRGRYTEAFKIFYAGEKEIEDRDSNAELYYVMADCYLGMRRFDKAIEARKKAVILNPGKEGYHYQLIEDYKKKGLFREAYEHSKECLRIKPDHLGCQNQIKALAKLLNLNSEKD
jgi:tetratricopeptide (TPR) repeat protein